MRKPSAYDDFFTGFGFGCVTGAFTTFDENSPVCGGFGFPRILMTSLRSSLSALVLAAERQPQRTCAPRFSPGEEVADSALRSLCSIRFLAWLNSFHCIMEMQNTPVGASCAARTTE